MGAEPAVQPNSSRKEAPAVPLLHTLAKNTEECIIATTAVIYNVITFRKPELKLIL